MPPLPSRPTTIALLLSPLGILLISATRILIVSDYNLGTAATIVTSGSSVNTLLGTIIPLVSILMPYFALALLYYNRVILSLLAFLAAVLVSPTPVTVSGAVHLAQVEWRLLHIWINKNTGMHVLGIVLLLLLLAVLLDRGFYATLQTAAPFVSLLLIPLVFQVYPRPLNNDNNYYSNLIRQPWIQAERITMHAGRPVIAYTLSTDNNWFTVLVASNRKIRYIHAGNIAKRRACQTIEPKVTKPLLTLIKTVPTVPMCQSLLPRSSSRVHNR
jgi:hypothetical protein